MTGGNKIFDQFEIELRDPATDHRLVVYIDVIENSLSPKWLRALNFVLFRNYHLEKNYCWFGFDSSPRTVDYLCNQINSSILAINAASIGYTIDDYFSPDNTIQPGELVDGEPAGNVVHEKMNALHRYFEDLQGVSGNLTKYYLSADDTTRWHIRQLNLLCHEYESLVLSRRKAITAPDWRRPSQLMCWLNAPRFELEPEDYELFGVNTINRSLGGVFVGVNKAVGKHHWEVFNDEGRDSRIGELVTSTLKSQTEAAGDFDIEWALDPSTYEFQRIKMAEFREWLLANGFDPADPALTIGHPQVAQVDLVRSFGTTDHNQIWAQLSQHLDVYRITTSAAEAVYDYTWSDADFAQRQIKHLTTGK